MEKSNNSVLNILGIIAMLLVIAITEWARKDTIEIIHFIDYVMLVSIGVIIYCLPDFFAYHLKSKTQKWYYSSEFLTITLLLFLAITGLVLDRSIINVLKYIFLPLSLFLLIREFFLFFKGKKFLPLLAGISLIVLILLIFYSRGYESPLFYEKILLGTAHIDVLFHGSISSIFSTTGYPSTGLNGYPYIPYHWGSHALIGGIKYWVGINSILFINIAFPAVFVGLFFKTFILFLKGFFRYKNITEINLLFVIVILVFLYSLPLYGFENAGPINTINNCIAYLFTFQYLSVLLNFSGLSRNVSKSFTFGFFLYSFISLLLLISFKISVGFVIVGSIVYLCFRYRKSYGLFQLAYIFFGIILILAFTYFFIFPKARINIEGNIIQKYYFLWVFSDSFISYTLGALIFFIIVLKENSVNSIKDLIQIFNSKKYIDIEILFVITLIGFTASIYVSSNPSDVSYFVSVQYYLSMPFIIYFLFIKYNQFKSSEKVRQIFLLSIVFLSILSRPDLLKYKDGFFQFMDVKKKSEKLSDKQIILKKFLLDINKLEKEINKQHVCIYIPQTEDWYYNSQKRFPRAAPFITPSISGIPMIGGIPDRVLNLENYDYGYFYYDIQNATINNMNQALKTANYKGFNKLIKYELIAGELDRETYLLNNN